MLSITFLIAAVFTILSMLLGQTNYILIGVATEIACCILDTVKEVMEYKYDIHHLEFRRKNESDRNQKEVNPNA